MILKSKIFRAYDIRGEAFSDFDEDGFFVIAAAFGKYIAKEFKLEKLRIFVSGDGRLSMGQLWPAVVSGLKSVGVDVTWGGPVPTPLNSFSLKSEGFDGAIQITASHNPANDNGLKLVTKEKSLSGDAIQEIRTLAECTECRKSEDFGECADGCQVVSFLGAYEKKLQEVIPAQKKQKVVIDCGNGVPGLFYPKIFRSFGHEVIDLYCDLDTSFPHHQPDPEETKNLQDLVKKVQEKNADFGFAFDGDGDRFGVVLGDGTIIDAGKILYVLASDFLSRHPGEKIITEVMSSATVIDKIKDLGGEVLISKTGHSFIEAMMHAEGASLAGEQSGHFIAAEDFYQHDDALLSSLRFITAIQKNHHLLQEITADWPELFEYSEKFMVPDEEKFEILEKLVADLQTQIKDQGLSIETNTLDGIRLDFGNSEWAIIRCSNTTPKIAIRLETKSEESLAEKKEWMVQTLEKYM